MMAGHRKIILMLSVSLLGICLAGCGMQSVRLQVSQLHCEYLENPIGIDMNHPRFSWVITSNQRGITQSAYRILVSDSPDSLNAGVGNIWDTGKVASSRTTNINYQGKSLRSFTTYYWKVQIWNQDDEASRWSGGARFTTGAMQEYDWVAGWIDAGDSTISAPLFRREFSLSNPVKSAYAFVSGVGYYELYINGKKVGDHELDPGMTDYRKRVLYAGYDVTDQVQSGTNVVGMMLGNGAWRMRQVEGRWAWHSDDHSFGTPRAFLQLVLTMDDGSRQRIVTDQTWRTAAGPITFNHFFGGESYDARLEQPGWSAPGFDDSEWAQARSAEPPAGVLDAQLMPPIKERRIIEPGVSTNLGDGVYLYDLGQNIPGSWRLKVRGEAGTTVRIRAAETLNDSLFPEPLEPGDKLSTRHPYHANVWTTYTLNGEGMEIYEPRFFYTGFRYIEVTVDPPGQIQTMEVAGRVIHSSLERNGKFVTSDSLLHRIHRATIWSQIGNTHSYPTDCPQREKGGYTGDGQVIAETSIHDFHMPAFYTKWLTDMRDARQENGRIPNTAPTLVGGTGGGIAWGSAYILIPWWMYQYYDDIRVLEEHYETMQDYIAYLRNLARSDSDPGAAYIINDFGGYWDSLGEWCAPGERDGPNHHVVSTYYYYLDTTLMSRIAQALGELDDAKAYRALTDTIKQAFNAEFFDQESALYGTSSVYQTYQLLALAGNVVPEDQRDAVFQTVVDDIAQERNGHVGTGILGTKHLWPVLVHQGRPDLAYRIVTRETYPGYGFWINNGATTLWEKWEGIHSHNHQMFGTVDEFFYKYLTGIHAPTDPGTTRGYRQILIRPYVPNDLEWVEASVETIEGTVSVRWERESGAFRLQGILPANTSGNISVPRLDFENISISEGGETIWQQGEFLGEGQEIAPAGADDKFITFQVGSGAYEFRVTGR